MTGPVADPLPPPSWGPSSPPPPPPGSGPPSAPGWGPPDPGWGAQPPGTAGWGDPTWATGAPIPPPRPTGGTASTGPLPLSPMGLGEILDGAFKLYRANFRAIALVALAFAGPVSVVAAVAIRDVNGGRGVFEILNDPSLVEDGGSFGGSSQLILQLVSTLILSLVGPLIAGVVAKSVATTYLGGQLTAGEAVRATWRLFPALLAAKLLVLSTEAIGLLGCLVGALAVMALWVVVAPAIVVEGLGPIQGMRRSLRLCSARYWPVLGIALLSGIITSTLASVIGGVPGVLALLIGYRWGFPLVALGSTATAVLVEPLTAIIATLVYFDLRIRQEGFDLQIMARNLGTDGAAAS